MKTIVLILDGDDIEIKYEVDNKFIFLINKKDCFHMDTTDGKLWCGGKLGKAHKKMVKKVQKELKKK